MVVSEADAVEQGEQELPHGWVWTTIGDSCQVNPGSTGINDQPSDLAITFVPMAAVDADSGTIVQPHERPLSEVRKGFTPFSEGDILFAKITPCMENGKSAVAHGLTNGLGFGSTEFHVMRPKPFLMSQWLFYFVRQLSFRRDAKASFTGTAGQLRVPKSFLNGYSLPLPPLAEQRRIVVAIETQFTRLDAGVATLKALQAKLKRYRAAVLKAAVEGELTREWRAAHPDAEPAMALLQCILRERRVAWERAELEKYARAGKTPPKGWQAKYREPAAPDVTDLPTLPEGWCWVSAEQLAEIETGATPLRSRSAYYVDGAIPWITSGALNEPFIHEAEEYITELALRETNAKIIPAGSLLIAMYGEGRTRGKVSELRIDAATNQACAALVFANEAASCKAFAKVFFEQNYEAIRRLSSGGVQPNLNLSIIRQTLIPFPPRLEQEQIVAEVERRLSVLAEVEATVQAQLKRAERLRQSILGLAFAGKLVPQDPSDEPASALLERIRRGHRAPTAVAPSGEARQTAVAAGGEARQLALPLDGCDGTGRVDVVQGNRD